MSDPARWTHAERRRKARIARARKLLASPNAPASWKRDARKTLRRDRYRRRYARMGVR
jgi:hypothetical protein